MIQPNTLCMIRGVPSGTPGSDCNGKIVCALEAVGTLWRFEPAVHTAIPYKTRLDLSEAKYLHPLDTFEDELAREALDEVLDRTFCETLQRELERL